MGKILPERVINVYTRRHGKLYNTVGISLKETCGTKEKLTRLGCTVYKPQMSVHPFMVINLIVIEIFQSGPKWCTKQQPIRQHILYRTQHK